MGNEPQIIYIGDTVSWRVSYADYPAADYDLTVYLQTSGTAAQSTTGSIVDDLSFDVTLEVSGSATGSAVLYYVFEGEDDRQTVVVGSVQIYANPSGSLADPRSHARRVLDAIEATLEGRASKDQQQITINGRTLSRTPLADLLKLRGVYRDEVRSEEAALRVAAGLGSGRKVLVRF